MVRVHLRLIRVLRRHWGWLSYVAIFTVAFIVFLILQASPVFADPDSFYHAKMALLLRDRGVVRDFPWLGLTVLGGNYTDQHFLYHALLIPFVSVFPPLIGLKLATVFFGAALVTVIYWMMRQFNVRWPLFFAAALLVIRPLTFRISLAKAPSTSLILLVLGLTWMFRHQLRRLGALAFVYVWYYGGFALLAAAGTTYAVVSAAYNRFILHLNTSRVIDKVLSLVGRRARRHRGRYPNAAIVATIVLGLAAGIVIHPYFPQNLTFYWHQLINIGVINFRNVIGVGAEWYPYNLVNLLANGALASVFAIIAVMGLIIRPRAQSKQTWALLLLAAFFFALTLKSRRYVEYYIPLVVLFSAFSISDTLRGVDVGRAARRIWRVTAERWWAAGGVVIVVATIVFGLGYIVGRDFRGELVDLRRGFAATKFAAASRWLEANTPPGSRVVHSDWDEFPVLFYYNAHNTYIVGLDPTFLYKADQNRYWTWANITLGKYAGDVYPAVTATLQSQYVFVAAGHDVMDRYFRNNPDFRRRYQDNEATVYEARPPAERDGT